MELLKVDTLEEAMDKLFTCAAGSIMPEREEVSILRLTGRILAEDIAADGPVPGFDRSAVDGYAVRACDTAGAAESIPVFLKIAGEVEMGRAAPISVGPGECMYVPTGGMIPPGADAVVMVEYCEAFGADRLAVYQSVSAGTHVVSAGEDMEAGQTVLRRGRKIRPADMGVLAAIGKTSAQVYKPWKVIIFSTGDEIVDACEAPGPGQVRDVNSYGLWGLACKFGFEVTDMQVAADDADLLEEKVRRAMEQAELVVISGGSSQGKKDATASVIGNLASSGVLTHGLAVKPGKPTILGFDQPTGTALIGLPGHPVAAMLLFDKIAGGLWERMTGQQNANKKPSVEGILTANVAASPGRKTWQLVTVDFAAGALPKVTPVRGRSGLIRTLSEADGYIEIDVNDEGARRGQQVTVQLF